MAGDREAVTKQARRRGRAEGFPRLLGGNPALDFVNTIDAPRSSQAVDFLQNYSDLARWLWHAGVLERTAADELVRTASARPRPAANALARALRLRTAMREVFSAVARGEPAPEGDLAVLHRTYRDAVHEAQLIQRTGVYLWSWDHHSADLNRPLWLLANAAMDLLREPEVDRVKECPGADDCGWLFYDSSRSRRRRWCSMEGCGSRVKMRRLYARNRLGSVMEDP